MTEQDILVSILTALNSASSFQWTLDALPEQDVFLPAGSLVTRETSKVLYRYKDGGVRENLDFELHILLQAPDSSKKNQAVEDLNAIGASLTIVLGTNKRLDRFTQVSTPALYRTYDDGKEEYSAAFNITWKRS